MKNNNNNIISRKDVRRFCDYYFGHQILDRELDTIIKEWTIFAKQQQQQDYTFDVQHLGEFLSLRNWKSNSDEELTKQGEREKEEIRLALVKDTFAQCEMCKMWDRLSPENETGFRSIPLLRSHFVGFTWLCDCCFNELAQKG